MIPFIRRAIKLVIHSIIIALVYFQLNEMGLKGCAFLRLGNLSWCNDDCLFNQLVSGKFKFDFECKQNVLKDAIYMSNIKNSSVS